MKEDPEKCCFDGGRHGLPGGVLVRRQSARLTRRSAGSTAVGTAYPEECWFDGGRHGFFSSDTSLVALSSLFRFIYNSTTLACSHYGSDNSLCWRHAIQRSLPFFYIPLTTDFSSFARPCSLERSDATIPVFASVLSSANEYTSPLSNESASLATTSSLLSVTEEFDK